MMGGSWMEPASIGKAAPILGARVCVIGHLSRFEFLAVCWGCKQIAHFGSNGKFALSFFAGNEVLVMQGSRDTIEAPRARSPRA